MPAMNVSCVSPKLVLAAICVVAVSAPAAFAGGSCPVNGLANGVSALVTDDPGTFRLNSVAQGWAAVALRNQDGNDWNLEVRTQSAPSPTCTSNTIAGSNASGPDVIAIDGGVGSPEQDYFVPLTGNGSGFIARIEYEQPAAPMLANTVFEPIATGPDDFLAVRTIQLSNGIPYSIRIYPSSDLGSLRVYVFAPTSTGMGRLGRFEAALEATCAPDIENRIDYTPTETGSYAIVIVNESGAVGTYHLAVGHCPFFTSILSEGVPRFFATLDDWPGFTPNARSWPVVGVRGSGHLYSLDVAPGARSQFGPFHACSDSIVGSQSSGLGTRLVTADFRNLPLRSYTAHATLDGQPQTSSAGTIEWDGAGDSITVNGAPIAVVPPPNNVLDAWKITLVTGITYTFQVVPAGGATAVYRLLLFGNPSPANPYWANRADAILEASGPHQFIPGHSGPYGVVVVNDNGGTGNYTVAVTANLVDVPTGPPAVAIRAAAPNPSTGAVRIEYELARRGAAEFRLRDVAGRTVATARAGRRGPGVGSFTLDLAGTVAPGVYFLSLVVDGVEGSRTRIILLR
jgi:hypothetical protein